MLNTLADYVYLLLGFAGVGLLGVLYGVVFAGNRPPGAPPRRGDVVGFGVMFAIAAGYVIAGTAPWFALLSPIVFGLGILSGAAARRARRRSP